MILVTGGTGYIGSHTVVALLDKGYEVVIIDNLSNSEESVLNGIKKITGKTPAFVKGDVKNQQTLDKLFQDYPKINAIIHFAAFKAVGESVEQPLKYYDNNVNGLIQLLKSMESHSVNKIVFSSSCTVYGQPGILPVDETAPVVKPESPYGNTKKINEEILFDAVKSGKGLKAISLRYFNPIGAHPSALIGELPIGVPNNLLPYITQTAIGIRKELKVFGNNYNTPDGTCIRDYININDLANAHVVALEYLFNQNVEYDVFNLGTGKGSSVLEVISAFEKSCNISLNYSFAPPRNGDVEKVWANPAKAKKILNWKAKISLEDTVLSAWEWENHYRKQLKNN
jgi:UDP-glucose 4-epimerase